jgi:hypothetical protein
MKWEVIKLRARMIAEGKRWLLLFDKNIFGTQLCLEPMAGHIFDFHCFKILTLLNDRRT